jgi:hypothetical protein
MKSRRLKNGRAETPSSREFLRDLIVGLQAFQSQRDWIIQPKVGPILEGLPWVRSF